MSRLFDVAYGNLGLKMMDLIELAENIAIEAHWGQFRRDGKTPYVEHPKQVVNRVGEDEYAKVVAWLHDVMEDTDETKESLLEKGIPEDIVAVLELLTHPKNEPYMDYLKRLKVNPLAMKVKIADMLTNLSDTPTERQILKYAKGLQFLLET